MIRLQGESKCKQRTPKRQLFKSRSELTDQMSAGTPVTIACTHMKKECGDCSVMSDSLWPHELHSPWNSPGQNTGVGSRSLLQGIFPSQGLNPGLLHCRWIFFFYQLSHQGSPKKMRRGYLNKGSEQIWGRGAFQEEGRVLKRSSGREHLCSLSSEGNALRLARKAGTRKQPHGGRFGNIYVNLPSHLTPRFPPWYL